MFEFLNEYSGSLMVLFTSVVTVSTVVYAFLTARLASETRQMRQAQTEPRIEVIVKPREEWINSLNLYVRNIGMGPAFDIAFEFRSDSGHEGGKMLINDFTESAFLKNGLKYLGPGQENVSNDTSMSEGFDQKIEAVLHVEVRYRSAAGHRIEEKFQLDFSEFRGLSSLGKPHLYAMAQSLEKMQKDIGHITTGFRKLHVDVFTENDRTREREQLEAERRERVAKTQANQEEES